MDKILLKTEALSVSILNEEEANPLLKGIGFSLMSGETLGIVGPSGSGKTMLARALIGLLPGGITMTSGMIQYFDENEKELNIHALSPKELDGFRRAHVAMIFQNPGLSLNPSMRIGKQFRIVSGLGVAPASTEQWRDNLTDMGFTDPVRILSAYPHQLSGGELQRAIIGMTILKAPRFWIADEPTTALDAETKVEIVRLLRQVKEKLQASMIYISHDLGTVRQLADRIVFMRDGRIERISATAEMSLHPSGPVKVHLNIHRPKPADPPQSQLQEAPVLEVKGLSKQFGEAFSFGFGRKNRVAALRNVSFRQLKGETLAVIGPSGSGKSTLGRLLTGLVKADTGSISFQERELTRLTEMDWRRVRRDIQLVHQNPVRSLTPQMTVEQHLSEAFELSGRFSEKQERGRQIERLMDELGLPPNLKMRYPFQISGGESQRVAIARALALRPSLVICDEITSALDRESQQQLIELMARLREEYAFSLLWITHDLNVVRQVADRLILLDQGKLIEESTTADFFHQPTSEKGRRMLEAYRMFD